MLKPTTRSGRLSVGFLAGFAVLIALFSVLVAAGQRGGEGFFDNLWLTAPMLCAWTCGLAAAITGTFALVVRRDRSLPVVLAATVGFLVTSFVIVEVAFPH